MRTATKILHWLPRGLCVLAILFVSVFALDAFAPGLTIWQQLRAFAMHLIPSFVLLALLLIAWKWELAGGIALAVAGLALGVPVFLLNYRRTHSVGTCVGVVLMLTFPFVVAGVLFVLSHLSKKRQAGAA